MVVLTGRTSNSNFPHLKTLGVWMPISKFPLRLTLGIFFLIIVMSVVGLSCTSGESETDDDVTHPSQFEESVQVLNPTGLFTVDDVVAAGWKKSKELSSETLPGATSVWYGFYNQRDVEVRIYESHETAMNSGTGPADEATGRGKPDRTGEGAGFFTTRMSYSAYAIVGNLILLCELDIEDCQGLFDAIK